MGITARKGIYICFLTVAAAIALLFVVFSAAGTSETAYAEDGLVLEYEKSLHETYDGQSKEITVNVTNNDSADIEYVWKKKNGSDYDVIGVGKTLSVKRPSDSGTYRCTVTCGGISETTDDILVTIGKITVTVRMNDAEIFYGENEGITYKTSSLFDYSKLEDEEEKDFVISCDQKVNEDIKNAVYFKEDELAGAQNITPSGHRKAGKYTISGHAVENEIYFVRFYDASFRIRTKTVYVSFITGDSIYGEEIKPIDYEVENPAILVSGETVSDLNIKVSRDIGNSSVGLNAGRYNIVGTSDNKNYNVVFRSAVYIIRPKKLTGYLIGASDLVYTGKTPTITCAISGEGANLDLTVSLTYDKIVMGAGEYKAYGRINDSNYELSDDGEFFFSIKKAPLEIKMNDVAYLPEAMATPEFSYYGFVNGETAEALSLVPPVKLPVEVGTYYDIGPSEEWKNFASKNYEIKFIPGTVFVYKKEMKTDNVTVKGIFVSDGKLTANEVETSELGGFGGITKIPVYALSIDTNDSIVNDYQKYSGETGEGIISEVKSGGYEASVECGNNISLFRRVCIVDSEGERHKLNDYSVKDGILTFVADIEGTVVIYYDLTPVYIIGAVVLVIALLLIIKGVRDKKKFRKALLARRIAQAYADDAKDRLIY